MKNRDLVRWIAIFLIGFSIVQLTAALKMYIPDSTLILDNSFAALRTIPSEVIVKQEVQQVTKCLKIHIKQTKGSLNNINLDLKCVELITDEVDLNVTNFTVNAETAIIDMSKTKLNFDYLNLNVGLLLVRRFDIDFAANIRFPAPSFKNGMMFQSDSNMDENDITGNNNCITTYDPNETEFIVIPHPKYAKYFINLIGSKPTDPGKSNQIAESNKNFIFTKSNMVLKYDSTTGLYSPSLRRSPKINKKTEEEKGEEEEEDDELKIDEIRTRPAFQRIKTWEAFATSVLTRQYATYNVAFVYINGDPWSMSYIAQFKKLAQDNRWLKFYVVDVSNDIDMFEVNLYEKPNYPITLIHKSDTTRPEVVFIGDNEKQEFEKNVRALNLKISKFK